MPSPIKVRRCAGCGRKVLEATCNSAGRCVACMVDEIERDKTLEAALAEIANDERDRAWAKIQSDEKGTRRNGRKSI